MLTHFERPLTRRYPAELFGHDPEPVTGGDGSRPRLLGTDAAFAFAFLLCAVLVGLATVALY